jgi:hypothetical protein
MKKTLFGIGLLTCLFALTPVYGQNEEAAIVLKNLDHPTGCFATSLTTMKSPGPLLHTEDQIHTVASPKGNVKLICHFDLPETVRLSKPFRDSGFLCAIYLPNKKNDDEFCYVITTRTTFLATPGGRATLTCETKANHIYICNP